MEHIEHIAIAIFALVIVCILIYQRRMRKDFLKEQKKNHEQLLEIKEVIRRAQESESLSQKQIHTVIGELQKQLLQLSESLNEAHKETNDLKKKLEFFTEIKADSTTLNSNAVSVESAEPEADNEFASQRLDEEQQIAYNMVINTNNNVFITGKAGTGKSYLLRLIMKETTKKVVVLAPTGIAALNVHGATLHSMFGYGNLVDLEVDQINENTIKLKNEKKKLLTEVDTIIIDEISMVRADIFTKINKILQVLNHTNAPFGGKQMVVFGDLFQLPPIAKRSELQYLIDTYGGRHFFHSPAYRDAEFNLFELTINHRQKSDAAFFEILNRIREGAASENDISVLNNRAEADITAERRITKLFSHKADAERINSNELNKISAKEYAYQCTIAYSKNNLTQNAIDDLFPITSTLRIKLGALVMMVTNDANHRWVNGTLGIVSFLDENCIKVTIDGYEYEVHPTSFEQYEAIYENGKISYSKTCEVIQYPIILAYAITIHKSQGMTYNKIGCDINKCFEAGQAYVALSRCTTLDGLYLLDKVHPNSLQVDREVADFYRANFSQ